MDKIPVEMNIGQLNKQIFIPLETIMLTDILKKVFLNVHWAALGAPDVPKSGK